MPTPLRPASAFASLLLTVLLVVAPPATAGEPHAATTTSPGACEHPCAHVEDCPKVTCECADASASGVAACDTEETHCCASANTACERFCEVNHQEWTGRYTPEGDVRAPAAAAAPGGDAKDASANAASAPCDEHCDQATDCRAITCQCTHAKAEDVAACDPKTHCCGSARIVCEHFCEGKKGKWTGKLVESAPPPDAGKSLRDLYDYDDDERGH